MSDEKKIDFTLESEKIGELSPEELDQVSGGSGPEEEEEAQH